MIFSGIGNETSIFYHTDQHAGRTGQDCDRQDQLAGRSWI